MECTVRWVGANAGMSFIGESGSGHAVVMDGAPEAGGRNLGPRPMEMLLMGTGGCSAFDVVLILQRARQKVSDCQVQLRATRAETDPKVFTDIHFHFVVSGQGLSESAVERAVKLSHDKYCSASIMLGQVAQITHSGPHKAALYINALFFCQIRLQCQLHRREVICLPVKTYDFLPIGLASHHAHLARRTRKSPS